MPDSLATVGLSATSAGPALLTLLLLGAGGTGWVVLGGVFVATGWATPALTRWALRPGGRGATAVTSRS